MRILLLLLLLVGLNTDSLLAQVAPAAPDKGVQTGIQKKAQPAASDKAVQTDDQKKESPVVLDKAAKTGVTTKALNVKPMSQTTQSAQTTPSEWYQITKRFDFPGNLLHFTPVLLRMDNGRFMLGWEEFTPEMKLQGRAQFFNEDLQAVSGAVATTNARVEFYDNVHEAVTFANGNVLVAFNENKNPKVQMGVFDSQNKVVKDLFSFSSSNISYLALTRLPGGNTVAVIYFDGRMRMAVLNSSGDFEVQPVPIIGEGGKINAESIRGLAVTTLPNGLIMVAYSASTLTTALIDQLGNNVRPLKRVSTNPQATGLSIVPLDEDRVIIGYLDQKDYKCFPSLAIVNSQGELSGGARAIYDKGADWVRPVRMTNGNLFVAFVLNRFPSDNKGLGFLLADASGSVLKGPSLINEDMTFDKRSMDMIAIPDDRILLFYTGIKGDKKEATLLILK